jgi:hypothetical protein
MLWASIAAAGGVWNPPAAVDLTKARERVSEAAGTDSTLLRQPLILAYKVALFLATGSMDTPPGGRNHRVSAEFGKGEEPYSSANVTVEFMGYADDSLTGERFTLFLETGKDGLWRVVRAERAAYGRGDHR